MEDKWSKYFQDKLTESEKLELLNQIEADNNAMHDFSRLNNAWAITQLLTQKQDTLTAQKGKKRLAERMKRKSTRFYLIQSLRYAAVICLVFTGTWYLAGKFSSGADDTIYTEIHVPSGQRLQITLADGSSVWLSPQSHLKIPNEFKRNNRIIEIDGEGLFTVVKDEKRPFIVKSKGYSVEVLGTKFNLFSYSKNEKYEAQLIEGKIQVYNDTNKEETLVLSPYEKVTLVNNQLVKSAFDYNNEEFLATGIYNFQTTSFEEILGYLSLWYNVQFEVKGQVMLTTKVNAKFRLNDDIENILIALQNVFRFNFKRINDNLIEISK